MGSLFKVEGPLFRFLNQISNYIILSILFILTSLPIVTLGASLFSLYSVVKESNHDAYISTFKNYFKAFFENLRKNVVITLFFIILIAIFLWLGSILHSNQILVFLYAVIGAMIILYIPYPFLLQTHYRSTLKDTLQYALFLMFYYMGYAIAIFLIPLLILVGLPWFNLNFLYFVVILGIPISARLQLFIFERIWQRIEIV